MVSGLVTSPCDQLRIFSGEAMLILMASKSATGLAMSKGLERYKVFLRVQNQWPVVSCQWPVQILARCQVLTSRPASSRTSGQWSVASGQFKSWRDAKCSHRVLRLLEPVASGQLPVASSNL